MTPRVRRLPAAVVALAITATTALAADPADAAARARERVGRVFARPEFDPLADAEKMPRPTLPAIDTSWLRPFMDFVRSVADLLGDVLGALFRGFRNLFSLGQGTGGAAAFWAVTVAWFLVAVAVGLLVWLLLRARRARRRRAAGEGAAVVTLPAGADDALARTPEDWRRRAADLAVVGRRREALRAMYLALLAELHRLGAVRYDRTRTNTAYVTDVPSRHPAREPFASITLRFDRCWYGGADLGPDEIRQAESEAEQVVRPFREEVRLGG